MKLFAVPVFYSGSEFERPPTVRMPTKPPSSAMQSAWKPLCGRGSIMVAPGYGIRIKQGGDTTEIAPANSWREIPCSYFEFNTSGMFRLVGADKIDPFGLSPAGYMSKEQAGAFAQPTSLLAIQRNKPFTPAGPIFWGWLK
jgi:hypothetical protein